MDLVGYVCVGHSLVYGYVAASCPGVGISSSNVPPPLSVNPQCVRTMMTKCQLRGWMETWVYVLWCLAPGMWVSGRNNIEWSQDLACGECFPSPDG